MAITLGMHSKFMHALIERLGLDKQKVRRLVIDCPCDGPILIYVELYGTTEVLDIEPPNVEECKVQVLKCE